MKIFELNEHTRLPLSLVISFSAAMAGGVVWATTVWGDVVSTKSRIEKLETRLELIQSIENRLSRIEGKLDALNERK